MIPREHTESGLSDSWPPPPLHSKHHRSDRRAITPPGVFPPDPTSARLNSIQYVSRARRFSSRLWPSPPASSSPAATGSLRHGSPSQRLPRACSPRRPRVGNHASPSVLLPPPGCFWADLRRRCSRAQRHRPNSATSPRTRRSRSPAPSNAQALSAASSHSGLSPTSRSQSRCSRSICISAPLRNPAIPCNPSKAACGSRSTRPRMLPSRRSAAAISSPLQRRSSHPSVTAILAFGTVAPGCSARASASSAQPKRKNSTSTDTAISAASLACNIPSRPQPAAA